MTKRWLRQIGYLLEAIPVYLLYGFFAMMSLEMASAVGGWLGRHVCIKLPMNRLADLNLQYVWPELGPAARKKIIIGMWDNFARVFAEYPHMAKILAGKGGHVTVHGAENLTTIIQSNKPAILLTGHFGNWEFGPLLSKQMGLPLALVYRAPNNPFVTALLEHARGPGATAQFRKGGMGARQIIQHMKKGLSLSLLVDQKMNDGLAVDFLGKPAMTAAAVADLALRHGYAIMMVRCQRIKGTHFEVTIMPPRYFEGTGQRQADILAIMQWINTELGSWVKAAPDQWLWLHQRWKKWPK